MSLGGGDMSEEDKGCMADDCDHTNFYYSKFERYCACHLPIDIFNGLERRLQTRAIEKAALENDSFEVTPNEDATDVDIRLKDD